jgi:hypothetical protein
MVIVMFVAIICTCLVLSPTSTVLNVRKKGIMGSIQCVVLSFL